jgi:nitrogen regulatory protein P-II 1
MNFKYVIAIVPPDAVEQLQSRLRSIGVGGITMSSVKGFGEYKNFFTTDWLTAHTKIELFVEQSKVDALVQALLEASDSDLPGTGVAAVMPVDRFVHLRTGTETLPESAGQPLGEH